MKKTLYMSLLAAAAMSAAGCQQELQPKGDQPGGERTVCFTPVMDGRGTPAITRTAELVAKDGSLSVPLSCTVSEGFEATDMPLTRGEQKNTTREWQDFGDYMNAFQVAAWKGKHQLIAAYEEVTMDADDGFWKTADSYAWAAGTELTFYAYANLPATEPGVAEAAMQCTSAAGQTLTYSAVPADATRQQDILLGFYSGMARYDAGRRRGGIADVRFYHPLTAVRFVKGTFENMDGDPSEVSFKRISLEGVYDRGTTELLPSAIGAENPGDKFEWDTEESGTQTAFLEAADGECLAVGGEDNVIGEPFILIPQTMTSDAPVKVRVAAVIDGVSKTLEATIDDAHWEAGKTNTYTLGYNPLSYDYTFTLDDGTTSGTVLFTNTDAPATDGFTNLVNIRTRSDGEISPGEWRIKSVQVGSEDAVTVNAESFSNIGGFSAYKSGNNISITSAARTAVSPGSNNFWQNISPTRTVKLDWSPDDWTDVTSSNPIDLSMWDFEHESRTSAMTTANCYIIRHAGTYKLPLVYGNGVVQGIENSISYYPGVTGGNYRLERFKNHLDAGITSSFIENNTGCAADKAEIVWQDKARVITNVTIEGAQAGSYDVNNVRYIKFTVDESSICQNNAVICIKDNNDRIIWSWHIWITNNPAIQDSAIAILNANNVNYETFPITCLGWFDPPMYLPAEIVVTLEQEVSGNTIDLVVKQQPSYEGVSSGTFYQFGRKDPLMNGLITTPAEGQLVKAVAKANTLGEAVQHPNTMYPYRPELTAYWGGNWDWCYDNNRTTYYNLWTGKQSSHGWDIDKDATITKTIYDPSPVGYMVPPSGAYTRFDFDRNPSPVLSSSQVGTYFKRNDSDTEGIFFGNVGTYTGADCAWQYDPNLNSIYGCGYYWTSHSLMNQNVDQNYSDVIIGYDNQSCACFLVANGWNKARWNLDRAFSCAIRPIKE